MELIDKQAAIDVINSHFGFNIEEEYGSAVQEVINSLPSAQPERKKGEWEYHSNPTIGINPETAYCSCCGFHVDTTDDIDFDEYNFCPRCGAMLKRGEEDGQN